VQPEFDLTYGMWFVTIWGSNTAFGKHIELDYYAGITPKWKDITFTIAGNAYTYPSSNPDISYFELHAGASWNTAPWTIAFNDYWSPDNFQTFGNSNAIDGTVTYAFKGKLWEFLHAQHQRPGWIPVVREDCPGLRVSECRPDARFPKKLVC
jgi:uncharacterized protein (TIGR02001 family)